MWDERSDVWDERSDVWDERSDVWDERSDVWDERSDVWDERSDGEMSGPTLAIDDPVLQDFASLVGRDGPVAVRGGGTRWDVGGPPEPEVRLIEAPSGVVDHAPEEMTVRVRGGTSVADLDAVLREHGQRSALPLRGGTVGGAIAVGEDHVEVLGRGRLRDSVLQVRYVSSDGRLVTGGGPVVKNVSGFNIPKLTTGSLGTLGLIAEVVLRTNPVPPVSVWLRSDDVDPFAVPEITLRPSAVLSDRIGTWVLLEGHGADVDGERRRLDSIGRFEEADRPPALPACRWSMAPNDLRSITVAETGAAVLSIGVGRIWAELDPPVPPADPVVELISTRMKQHFDPGGRLNPGRRP